MARRRNNEPPIETRPLLLDPRSYRILDGIGGDGENTIVFSAECVPLSSKKVAIKLIDLARPDPAFAHAIRSQLEINLDLFHPNILKNYWHFTVHRHLWMVMPLMAAGSIQSIVSFSFFNGLPESCSAVVLKEVLQAMAYLHDKGHPHRGIKPGNILLQSDGSVKLADFGVLASSYEKYSPPMDKPYWLPPEVDYLSFDFGLKADIWSFGITALELAYGCPPLSQLPHSHLMKMIRRRFLVYDNNRLGLVKDFSPGFKDLVKCCLQEDPEKRPSAERLLGHRFFRNCKDTEFLQLMVVGETVGIERRFRKTMVQKLKRGENSSISEDGNGRICGWKYNDDTVKLEAIQEPQSSGSESREEASMEYVMVGLHKIFLNFPTPVTSGAERSMKEMTQEDEVESVHDPGESSLSPGRRPAGRVVVSDKRGLDKHGLWIGLVLLKNRLEKNKETLTEMRNRILSDEMAEGVSRERLVEQAEGLVEEFEAHLEALKQWLPLDLNDTGINEGNAD